MKNKYLIKLISLCFYLLIWSAISAQTIDDNIYQYSKMHLPPLNVLFENAYNTSSVEYYKSLREYEKKTLSAEKRSWLKYFQIGGLYYYGVNAVQSMDGSLLVPKKDPQDWYNIGASLAVPLDDLFDRGGKVKRQKLKIQSADHQLETAYGEIKMEIVELYTQVQKEIDILKLQLEQFTLAKTNYEQSRLDFSQNKISIQEFSNQKDLYNGVIVQCLNSKYTIESLILKLEILSQTKIFN
ncbi:MAG: TolC family protein [Tannerella sp.]|jgi:outer membrane protein TolC|nr:TolC family protein [Tannerella sp.]